MNCIHENVKDEIKCLPFANLDEINQYMKLTTTSRAQEYAKLLFPHMKSLDNNVMYYYNIHTRLWTQMCYRDYHNFTFVFFNETINHIKSLDVMLFKEITQLLKDFDSKKYIEDIVMRSSTFLKDTDFILRFDATPNLFPLKGGKKLDFKTLLVTDRTHEDYFTYESPCDFLPDSKLTHANKFFNSIMIDEESREYMRKVLGYTITGETSARCFFIWYGHGSNGKSQVFHFVNLILGKQYHQCDKSIFIKVKNDSKGASPELVSLLGKRGVVYSEGETSDAIEMNMSTIKQITGEDSINARQLYSQPIVFKPYCKLHMLTNFTPGLNEEKAVFLRTRYVFLDSEFLDADQYSSNKRLKHQFVKDKGFMQDLETKYLSEVFTWIALGAHEFFNSPVITMPEPFQVRTEKIFKNEDSLSSFIARRIRQKTGKKIYVTCKQLVENYQEFCKENSLRCHRRSELTDRLLEKGIHVAVRDGYNSFINIELIDETSLDAADIDIQNKHFQVEKNYEQMYYDLLKASSKCDLPKASPNPFKEISDKIDSYLDQVQRSFKELKKIAVVAVDEEEAEEEEAEEEEAEEGEVVVTSLKNVVAFMKGKK
jgi:P4 family phage/plasmid primase-like protien